MHEKHTNPAALAAALAGDYANAAVASTPGGIEAQEATAQRELQDGTKLWKLGTILPEGPGSETNQKRLEALGFVFGAEIDALFVSVRLPKGWAIKPTGHSMWSTLHDQQDQVRAKIFYKGAFYDRRASFHLE